MRSLMCWWRIWSAHFNSTTHAVAVPLCWVDGLERRVLLSGAVLNSISLPPQFAGGSGPQSQLVMDSAGNLFGTTASGGSAGLGTVFEIPAGTNTVTYLVNFNGLNGASPVAGVTLDSSGNLFGTTSAGGSSNVGTVFEIAQGTTAITTLVTFDGTNGEDPQGALSLDSSGNLFGTTSAAENFSGTVFEIVHGTTAITTLGTFPVIPQKLFPAQPALSGVTLDSNGDIFGTTTESLNGTGSVFEIQHGTTAVTTLATFDFFNAPGSVDAGVVIDADGNLFGTTETDGANRDGTVFEILQGTNTITTLATFDGTNGANPVAALQFDANGNLFGTTKNGGDNNDGTVFKIAAGNHAMTVVASFNSTNGASPEAGVVFDSNGNLFGTTALGGSTNQGTVFEIQGGQSAITPVLSFNSVNTDGGANPSGITLDADGNLFGTTTLGGTGAGGTVFEISKGSSTITTLGNFVFDRPTGSFLDGPVSIDADGNLFGTAHFGGAADDTGTIFEIAHGTSTITVLYDFQTATGVQPSGGVTFDAQGNLFGTILVVPGPNHGGSVFELAKGSTSATLLGNSPVSTQAPFTLGPDGHLFGTAFGGGSGVGGIVYEIVDGNFNTLGSFDGTNGSHPQPQITFDSSGDIFGTTYGGGANNLGTIFEIVHGSGVITTLLSFDGTTNGQHPNGIVMDAAGNIFGTTSPSLGVYQFSNADDGTLFELAQGATAVTTLATFNGQNGAYPTGGLSIDSSGNIFGITGYGGDNDGGTVFEVPGIAVVPQSTSTVLTLSGNPVITNGSVVLTAVVATPSTHNPVPDGTVVFYQDGINVGNAAIGSNGVATFSLSNLTNGTSQLTATYFGGSSFSSSTSAAVGLTITPYLSPLVPTIAHSTLPAIVVKGANTHGHVTVDLTNTGGAISSGTTSVVVYASFNGVIDGRSIPLGRVSKKLMIHAGKKIAVSVPVSTLTADVVGNYTLLAEVTDPSASINATSTGPALVGENPQFAFSETRITTNLKSPAVIGAKTRASVRFEITNIGNIPSRGESLIGLFVTTDGGTSLSTPIRSVQMKVAIRPGKSRVIVLPLVSLPVVTPGSYHLVVQLTDVNGNVSQGASVFSFALAIG